ncbi:flagellar hook-length control protein FliK [Sphingomonas sp. UYAg733]
MIEFSTALARATEKAPNSAASGGDRAQFATTLADFLDAGEPAPPDTPSLPGRPTKRQDIAGGGEALPDDADSETDPTLIWMPIALPQPAPVMRVIPVPGMALKGVIESTLPGGPALLPPTPGATDPLSTVPDRVAPTDAPKIDVCRLLPVEGKPAPTKTPIQRVITVDKTAVMDDIQATTAKQAAPQPAPAATAPVTQPAVQAFAAAILATASHRERRDSDDRSAAGAAMASALSAVAETALKPIVQATGDLQRAALDLRQDTGLQAMIDRIEVLRDDADSRDTRIRLVPDALGAVDIAVRKDGDRLHVHFAAESAATRALLTEAQPRLAELAEARGVRIAQSTVDGSGHGPGRQPHQQASAQSVAPVSVTRATETEHTTEHRIA